MSTDRYQSPLSERYASKEMQYIFTGHEFLTWRRLRSHWQRQRKSWD